MIAIKPSPDQPKFSFSEYDGITIGGQPFRYFETRENGHIFVNVTGEGVPTLQTRWDRATGTLSWEIDGGWGLERVGAELLVRQQGATDQYVPLDDGVASLPGDAKPDVFPVGWLAEVR